MKITKPILIFKTLLKFTDYILYVTFTLKNKSL